MTGIVSTIVEAFAASTQSPNRGAGGEETSAGAYWCTDCSRRIRDVDYEASETPRDGGGGAAGVEGEEPPPCPDCGEEMTFERSAATTGCAC
ncbi:hypothetical protein HUG12_02120 [Halorarum salinum]|uniref:Small CPxCG-related zinc finger protein n=1 Tax=Halorarum salinum TaxID=2743089 RepID=A0A7D5QCS8_9EURY|nr:hypothetical protein HUG12_02120 [Halobaculum salinum]